MTTGHKTIRQELFDGKRILFHGTLWKPFRLTSARTKPDGYFIENVTADEIEIPARMIRLPAVKAIKSLEIKRGDRILFTAIIVNVIDDWDGDYDTMVRGYEFHHPANIKIVSKNPTVELQSPLF